MENILIIGSGGQLGSELEDYLVSLYGREKIYSSDIKKNNSNSENFILLDALNKDNIYETKNFIGNMQFINKDLIFRRL